MKHRSILLRGALIAGVLSSLVTQVRADNLPVTYNFAGYVQGRYTDTFNSALASQSTFEAKRIIGCLYAHVGDHIGAFLDVSGASTDNATKVYETKVIEAYGEYITAPWKIRLGLSRTPFGYEEPLASNQLITLERSQVINALMPTSTYGYDKGLFTYYDSGTGPKASLGIVNGENLDQPADSNNTKNFVGRVAVRLPKKRGEIGASIYIGRLPVRSTTTPYLPIAGSSVTAQRYALDSEYYSGPFTVLTEWLKGNDNHVISNGGYVTVAYQKQKSPIQPYLRFDVFNPNEDSSTNKLYRRYSIGLNRYLAKYTKWTIEYDNIHDGSTPTLHGLLATQLQVSF